MVAPFLEIMEPFAGAVMMEEVSLGSLGACFDSLYCFFFSSVFYV